jgi:hypothetical protein
MARIASSSANVIDLSSPWNGVDNPWLNLLEGEKVAIASILNSLGYRSRENFNNLQGYIRSVQGRISSRIVIVRHPLWTDNHPLWQRAVEEAQKRYPGYEIVPANPFRILRRPVDYV